MSMLARQQYLMLVRERQGAGGGQGGHARTQSVNKVTGRWQPRCLPARERRFSAGGRGCACADTAENGQASCILAQTRDQADRVSTVQVCARVHRNR